AQETDEPADPVRLVDHHPVGGTDTLIEEATGDAGSGGPQCAVGKCAAASVDHRDAVRETQRTPIEQLGDARLQAVVLEDAAVAASDPIVPEPTTPCRNFHYGHRHATSHPACVPALYGVDHSHVRKRRVTDNRGRCRRVVAGTSV